jgi:hypothetical protein
MIHNHPYGSDRPWAVRGPWRAVLTVVGEDLTIGFDQWMVDGVAWAYDGREFAVAVVRGTATPMDTDDNGVGTLPTVYSDEDVLYRHDGLADDDAVARWAQARMVAALLNANQEKLDILPPTRPANGAARQAFRERRAAMAFRCQSNQDGSQCTGTVRISPEEEAGQCPRCGTRNPRDVFEVGIG